MAPCHHFAEQALSILRYLAKKWNVDVDIPQRNGSSTSATDADADADEDEDANIRSATSSLNFFVPKVVETDFICDWNGPGGQLYKTVTATPGLHQNQPPPHMSGGGGDGGAAPAPGESVDSRMGGMEDVEETATHPAARGQGGSRNQHRGPRDPIAAAAVEAASQPQAVGSRVAAAMEPLVSNDEPGEGGAKSFENPLFWPFPMQGRPMLPEGPRLREAGFEPL